VTPGKASPVQAAVNGQLCVSNVVAVGRTEIYAGSGYFLSPTKMSHGDLLEQLGADLLRNGADHFRFDETWDTVGQPPGIEICVSHMPALKAKKLGKLPRDKVLLEL
jgi:hypothetical protein